MLISVPLIEMNETGSYHHTQAVRERVDGGALLLYKSGLAALYKEVI